MRLRSRGVQVEVLPVGVVRERAHGLPPADRRNDVGLRSAQRRFPSSFARSRRLKEALGEHAARVLPAPLRSRAATLNLPAYKAAMLDYLAAGKATTPGDLVSRQLHDLETESMEALLSSVPGFAEAMNWMQHAIEPGERF